jgi:hypothetical protein
MKATAARGPILGVLLLGLAAAPAGADAILDFSLAPPDPTTGDPIRLEALVGLDQDCVWGATAGLRFGDQAELGPAPGWAIDLRIEALEPLCAPVPAQRTFGIDLGPQSLVGAAPGVLRLFVDGALRDTAFFDLEVRAGAAPGWRQPALHDVVVRPTQCAALTFVPGRLVMADRGLRRILLVDPATGGTLGSVPAPGNGDVRGLAWDGSTYLYASVDDTLGPRLYRLDLAGRVFEVYPSPTVSPGNEPLEGLAFLGGVLYGLLGSPPILYAIDPATRQVLWQRAAPTRLPAVDAVPGGILAIDPSGTIYLLEPRAGGQDRLLADVVDNGITGIADLQGFAFDGLRGYAWNAARSEILWIRSYALWWAVDGTLRGYLPPGGRDLDVARGEVARLRQLSSNVDLGPLVCLTADGAGGVVPDAGDPPAGEAWFYVARFTSAEGFQLSYGRSSAGFRRIDLGSACP